ncbi:hypothetical protein CXG81DRAFT_16908 [Caulochytrium protostelioides]|uniref:Signal recognition particle subunit SRP72 n=1 Tax=Caulochytrium protostelioides TaxID=1555241 RepID=A0A4P9XDE3_9FUNG|nr:hypothetical protein CXG81DRAFT_16908 [Caulochytrium protostelioides]|eukprot:RKP03526.1 hypothetical protein CXG81DRAFT_16908 [Caulochytrium protostelioides]
MVGPARKPAGSKSGKGTPKNPTDITPGVAALYRELADICAKEEEVPPAKIVAAADADAAITKIIALCTLDKIKAALEALDRVEKAAQITAQYQPTLHFLRSYLLYRLNRCSEALAFLQAIPHEIPSGLTEAIRLLELQILYKSETSWPRALELMGELLNSTTDETHIDAADMRLNYVAVKTNALMALAKLPQPADFEHEVLKDEGYEMFYNRACLAVACGDWDEAATLLERAAEACRAVAAETSDPLLRSEIDMIETQQLYIASRLQNGSLAESQVIQLRRLWKTTLDHQVRAVSLNNLHAAQQADPGALLVESSLAKLDAMPYKDKLNASQRMLGVHNQAATLFKFGETLCAKNEMLRAKTCFPLETRRADPSCGTVSAAIQGAKVLSKQATYTKGPSVTTKAKSWITSPTHSLGSLLTKVRALAHGNASDYRVALTLVKRLLKRYVDAQAAHLLPGLYNLKAWLHTRVGDRAGVESTLDEAATTCAAVGATAASDAFMKRREVFTRHVAPSRRAVKLLQRAVARGADAETLATYSGMLAARSRFRAGAVSHARWRQTLRAEHAIPWPPTWITPLPNEAVDALERNHRAPIKRSAPPPPRDDAAAEPMDVDSGPSVAPKKRRQHKVPSGVPAHLRGRPDPERWLPKASRKAVPAGRKHMGKKAGAKPAKKVSRTRATQGFSHSG